MTIPTFLIFQAVYTATVVTFFGGILSLVEKLSFTDGLFMAASAFSCTGLVTVDFAAFTPGGQFLISLTMLFGCLSMLAFTASGIKLFSRVHAKVSPILVREGYTLLEQTEQEKKENHNLIWVMIGIVGYFIISVFVGGMILSIWAINNPKLGELNPFAWGFFHAYSGFNNAGFSTMIGNASFVPWVDDAFPLVMIAILAMMGNTMFPVVLRLLFFRFGEVLATPRTYALHLFDPSTTIAIFLINFGVTIFGVVMFYVTAPNLPQRGGILFTNSLFSSVMTRTTGFNSLDIGKLPVPLLVVYIAMMFFASTPVLVSISQANSPPTKEKDLSGKTVQKVSIYSHFRRILSQHLLFLFLALLIICLLEEFPLDNDQYCDQATSGTPERPRFSFLSVLFELVSAYGTVGLSMGYSGFSASLVGKMTVGSKVVLTAVMLMGRLRGIPNVITT